MKLKKRKEIKRILQKNISDEEKRNAIANLKNCKTDVARIIQVDRELNLKVGQIWDNRGEATSWADINDENSGASFMTETKRKNTYVLEASNIKGYKVQYFNYDKLFEKLYYDEDMTEDEADKIAYKLSNDEVYNELMDLLGADSEMDNEREILIPAETKMKIVEISDERDEVGRITVKLETI